MEFIRAHVYVKGQVQGVFFRAWMRDAAQELGLTGWVRNLADGRVEAVFEGTRDAVEEVIEKCRQGPLSAAVEHVDIIWEKATGEFVGFEVRR